MLSITFELCIAEDDPYDRSLGILVKSGQTIEAVRSMRLSPQVRIGRILLTIDRLMLAAAVPELRQNATDHLHDVWDQEESSIGYGPFPE